jgi:hypothetical protein
MLEVGRRDTHPQGMPTLLPRLDMSKTRPLYAES